MVPTCSERPCNLLLPYPRSAGLRASPTSQRRRSPMAVITRQTLVLRGVSVLRDGLTVVARLGSGYQAQATQTPAPFSMRHPQPFNAGANQAERWLNPEEHRDASSRAGRSASTGGVLNRAVLGGPFVPAAR